MATGYLEILRARHATRLLVGTLIGRLPNATAPIAIVLFVRAEGGSYSLAGVLAAVYGVANAVGQPVLGRLVDLKGQPRVQLPAALLSAAAMSVFAYAGTGSLVVAYAAVALAGLFTPPLEGGLRALWSSVLPKEEHVHRAYALDAVAQEVMFAVGPLLVTVCVSLWSAQAALLVLNVIGVLGPCPWSSRRPPGPGAPRRVRRTGWARCARRASSRCSAPSWPSAWRWGPSRWPP